MSNSYRNSSSQERRERYSCITIRVVPAEQYIIRQEKEEERERREIIIRRKRKKGNNNRIINTTTTIGITVQGTCLYSSRDNTKRHNSTIAL